MLFSGPHGPSLVSEEFNRLCVQNRVEFTIKPLPNPGNPFQSIRMAEVRSFSDQTVRVIQNDRNKTVHNIPAQGSVQFTMKPDEPLPDIEQVDNATD